MFRNLKKTYVISEIGINGNGDLNLVHDMIYASKEAGADCIKLQKRDIDLVYTPEVLASPRASKWGTTVREQKLGLEFGETDYNYIVSLCRDLSLDFTASPWDINSLKFLVDMGVPFIKIPSALATNKAYLKACADTKLPLVLSTGMCSESMINHIVWYLENCNANLQVIMHCISTYPTSLEEMNLRGISTLKKSYARTKYVIGHSGHDELVFSSSLAVALGAQVIERHFTMDKNLDGTDQKSSLEPNEFKEMVSKVRICETALGSAELAILDSEKPIAKKLRMVNDFEQYQ